MDDVNKVETNFRLFEEEEDERKKNKISIVSLRRIHQRIDLNNFYPKLICSSRDFME